ncbi:MFS multidrug transporter-like protein [Coleophoma cylindrospora]|uniref:MFS multidrug transporter-like protein n=1 Tax=Coleophoma cylindrospora TaxID=1849047 RepID=A0A3D8RLL2_9HELO|nr:MFS multidrug transporter-like protein [Coleophoma cylindrospora]
MSKASKSLPYLGTALSSNGRHLTAVFTEETSTDAALPGPVPGVRRRSNVSGNLPFRDAVALEDFEPLSQSASAVSGHGEAYAEAHDGHHPISRPKAARPGPATAIREVPSELNTSAFNTPVSTRPPSPVLGRPLTSAASREVGERAVVTPYPDVGTLSSWRGVMILIITCGAQLLDNVFMTGVNISLPAIQREFSVEAGDLQWLISAYTLTFGGFLLLAGVLADRHGRKFIFCAGMFWISAWTLANGFGTSFIQVAIFRALQGIGAAMTVPSSVGIISSYFVAKDRTTALSIYAASGAVGFCSGLIFGGFLTSSLGWRYLFRVSVIITGSLGILGLLLLPRDRLEGQSKPRLDILGAGLSTGGLILLSFVLSSGGVYGWSKAFIIVLLVTSVALLGLFTWVEKKVQNPIMPLSLWKIPNFAALWVSGFVTYGSYQIVIYYTVLIAQEVNGLSAGQTALRFLPMGAMGFACSLGMGSILERFDHPKVILLFGMALCIIAPIPSSLIKEGDINFWTHVLPTSLIIVAGVTIVYCSCTIILLGSVPMNVKSLCGGMINTAFQIGSGVGLALASAIVQAVQTNKGHGLIQQYSTGLWCCVGFASIGFFTSLFGIRKRDHLPAGISTIT